MFQHLTSIKKIFISAILSGGLVFFLTSCEDDVLLEDIETTSKKGGSYGKLIMNTDTNSNSQNYLYNNKNTEIY